MLLPPPFSDLHDGWLRNYSTGRTVTQVVDRSRRVFGLHKNGTIFPMVLTVKQVSGGLSGSRFLAMITLERVPDTEHFLLVDSKTNIVTRCSGGCFPLLGMTQADVGGSSCLVSKWIPALKLQDDAAGLLTYQAPTRMDVHLKCSNGNEPMVTLFVKSFGYQVRGCVMIRIQEHRAEHRRMPSDRTAQALQGLDTTVYTVAEEDPRELSDSESAPHPDAFSISIESDQKEHIKTLQTLLLHDDTVGGEAVAKRSGVLSSATLAAPAKGRIDAQSGDISRRRGGGPKSTGGAEDSKSIHASAHGGGSVASSARTSRFLLL